MGANNLDIRNIQERKSVSKDMSVLVFEKGNTKPLKIDSEVFLSTKENTNNSEFKVAETLISNETLTTYAEETGIIQLFPELNTNTMSELKLEYILIPRYIEPIDELGDPYSVSLQKSRFHSDPNNYYLVVNGLNSITEQVSEDFKFGDIVSFDIVLDEGDGIIIPNQKRIVYGLGVYSGTGANVFLSVDLSDYDFLQDDQVERNIQVTNFKVSRHFANSNDFIISWFYILDMSIQNTPLNAFLFDSIRSLTIDSYGVNLKNENAGELTIGSETSTNQTRGTVDLLVRAIYKDAPLLSEVDTDVK
jgi:hypothetical protein